MDSILTSIKKMLGIEEEYEHFDQDLIMHINTSFDVLTQIGVGSSDGFSIKDKTAKWSDFIGTKKNLDAVRSYIYLRVRLIFDPPSSSAATDSMKRICDELEWRLHVTADKT